MQSNPNPSKQEIEDSFDGNICRCTGTNCTILRLYSCAADNVAFHLVRTSVHVVSGADPEFSEGWFGQTSAYIIYLLLLFDKSFFSQEKV